MSTAAPLQNTAAKSPLVSNSSHAGLLLQRKCACGSPISSLSGKCEQCKEKRLQAKLTIGASNDPLEQEADRVADQVLAAPANPAVDAAPLRIQRFTGQSTADAGTAPASVDRVLSGSGRPLGTSLQKDMGNRFGYDFSSVRVHTGSAAEQSARDVNAHAYTVGSNVVFGARQFAPESHAGRKLIAHELTHVVQQGLGSGGNTVMPYQIEPSDSPYEMHTDASADAGHTPMAITPAFSLIQRRAAPYIKKVTVHLAPPQSTDLEWEGTPPATATGSDHFTVSTGKGYSDPGDSPGTCTRNCCSDPMTQCAPPWNQPSRVGACCTYYGNTFWTGTPSVEHNGWQWWTPIQPFYSSRGIALHQHTEVTGQPIGHGCVRMDEPNAKRIYDYSNGRRTNVTIDGRAAPVACDPDRQCNGRGVKGIQREEDTNISQQKKKVLVTGFNDWRDLVPPQNVWYCNMNPSCRLLVGNATTSQPTSYAGPLVSQLSSIPNINWEFKTMPVTWGIAAQTINYQNYDAVINMGLDALLPCDVIQLEQGAYNARSTSQDAVGAVPSSTSIDSSKNAVTTLSADPRSDVNQRVTAVNQSLVDSHYTVNVAQARQNNNYICNETHYHALYEMNKSLSSTPQGRLKLVYFIHLPDLREYSTLAGGTAQVVRSLIG